MKVIVAVALTLLLVADTAALPTGASAAQRETDGNTTLADVLARTGRAYAKAKAAVDRSVAEQTRLTAELRTAERQRDALKPQVQAIAAQQYAFGRLSTLGFLLNSGTSSQFTRRAVGLGELTALNDAKLRDYNTAVTKVAGTKAALDKTLATQRRNLTAMDQQGKAADKALALVGGTSLTGGDVDAVSATATAAPRNATGEFSPESCTVKDPTTDGCITGRTLNMLNSAEKAGFSRFVGCYRPGGPFEHPKGRACDWSLQQKGFSNARNQDMKKYGNDLMAYLVRNADRLGILYVIWYRQVWFPGRGWSQYTGPLDHYDHVHVSML